MIIAVPYQNGEIFQHFGHTEAFKLYGVQDGTVVTTQIAETGGSGHGALAGFLREKGVTDLICGGIGGGARTALAQAGIRLYPGVTGEADKAAEVAYDPETTCAHHDHGEGHSCGEHSCGH